MLSRRLRRWIRRTASLVVAGVIVQVIAVHFAKQPICETIGVTDEPDASVKKVAPEEQPESYRPKKIQPPEDLGSDPRELLLDFTDYKFRPRPSTFVYSCIKQVLDPNRLYKQVRLPLLQPPLVAIENANADGRFSLIGEASCAANLAPQRGAIT